jgi:hypothetical protein
MATTRSIGGWRDRPDVTMAGLGLISGVASANLGFSSSSPFLTWLQPLATLFGLSSDTLPIGFYFAVVIAFSIWRWTGKVWSVPVLLITTMYAWSAALQVGIRLQTNSGDDPHLIAASLAAGAVGAGLTHLGCALFSLGLRRPLRIAVTCVVGALAGMLLYMSERKMIDMQWLFIVWQPAVAFCIGMGLAGRDPQS